MEFKEGDWIIRKWKDTSGGELDFVQIKEFYGNSFLAGYFFRYGRRFEDLTRPGGNEIDITMDERIEFEWRKPTQDELNEYLILESKPFEI